MKYIKQSLFITLVTLIANPGLYANPVHEGEMVAQEMMTETVAAKAATGMTLRDWAQQWKEWKQQMTAENVTNDVKLTIGSIDNRTNKRLQVAFKKDGAMNEIRRGEYVFSREIPVYKLGEYYVAKGPMIYDRNGKKLAKVKVMIHGDKALVKLVRSHRDIEPRIKLPRHAVIAKQELNLPAMAAGEPLKLKVDLILDEGRGALRRYRGRTPFERSLHILGGSQVDAKFVE